MEQKLKNICTAGLGSFILIAIDQLSKYWALSSLNDQSITIIKNWVYFELHVNEGIAFSLPIEGVFVPILALLFLSFFIIKFGNKYFKTQSFLYNLLLALMFGGAISNLIDRFIHNAVIDFISVTYFSVFNIADSAITLAAVIIIVFQKKIFKENN